MVFLKLSILIKFELKKYFEFNFGINKISPKIIIITPLTFESKLAFFVKNEPIEVVIAAKDMNTTENPNTNCIAPINFS